MTRQEDDRGCDEAPRRTQLLKNSKTLRPLSQRAFRIRTIRTHHQLSPKTPRPPTTLTQTHSAPPPSSAINQHKTSDSPPAFGSPSRFSTTAPFPAKHQTPFCYISVFKTVAKKKDTKRIVPLLARNAIF